MIRQQLSTHVLPDYTRRNHPLVRHYLRRSHAKGLNYAVFGSSLGLFLVFGGLSLPMLYLLVSLMVVLQQAVATTQKIHDAREKQTWDLLRLTPFSRREVLISAWAGSYWQLNQTWMMPMYRLLQGLAVVGVVVFSLWFGAVPMDYWLVVLVAGTLLILLQPFVEMYFSGMVGLLCANTVSDRLGAVGLSIVLMVIYWCGYVSSVLLLLFGDPENLGITQIGILFSVPLLLPLALGYTAQRVTERMTV